MDPWDHIRRAAADTRSGSVGVTLRAAAGMRLLHTRAEQRRAARRLLQAHPAMAPLWRLIAVAWDADDVEGAVDAYVDSLRAGTDGAADGARWAVTAPRSTVLTHSSSRSVADALERVRARIERVLCTASLPGGEGRPFARRLSHGGFATEVVADAAIARACARADVVLVGADAVTERAVVNKVGTYPLALAAREAGIGCYAIASTHKLLPHRLAPGDEAEAFDAAPLDLFDAVLTERGPRRPAAIRRAVSRVVIPAAVERLRP